jgi:predicted O-linked N-acetylglucosamine transferase (SPINDLY family)
MGFTQRGRVNVMAMRPAPLQVSYLGWSATMGGGFIDYILGDEVIIPREHEPFYSEKIAYLPHSFMVADSARAVPDIATTRHEAGLPDRGFVFCSFNNSYKFTPEMFAVWMRILGSVEGSVLWLPEGNASARRNLRREADARGVASDRIVFAPYLADCADHLARLPLADLFLDTLPCNAHTTASDALWAGLPVLTCKGATFAGRVAASLLHAAGLDVLVTDSLGAYEATAVSLAHDRAALGAIRKKLAQNRTITAAFDTARFTRHLEAAYTQMHARAQTGAAPQSFAVGQGAA